MAAQIFQALTNRFWRLIARNWRFAKGRTRVQHAAWRGIKGRTRARDSFGCLFNLDLEEFVDCEFYLHGGFETEGIELLARLAEERDCTAFIDIGAYIGAFSLPLARRPGIEKVYGFEAHPDNFARYVANIELNGLGDVIAPFNVALSSESGSAQLFISDARMEINALKLNQGTTSLVRNPDRHTRSIQIKKEPLDNLLDLEGRSLAIKIDVEGHEAEVLRGMKNLLRSNACVLHIEIFPERLDEVDELLRELGLTRLEQYRLEGDNYIYASQTPQGRV